MKQKLEPVDSLDLRRQAEEIMKRRLDTSSPEDTQRLFHELQVHQIELELQNEELRRAQLALEASRERYVDLYDFAPVGYFTLSDKGLILEVNLTGASLLELERGKLLKQPLSRFFLREDQDSYYFCIKQLSETRKPNRCEVRLTRKDSSPFWVRLDSVAIQDAESNLDQIRIIMSDITERKQAEQELARHRDHLEVLVKKRTTELRSAIEQLRGLDHLKDAFIANVSHELRMPLTNIKLYLHMLDLKPEKRDTYMATLKRETERLASIVEDLLFVSRATQEQKALDITPVDLNAMVEIFVTDRTAAIESRGLALNVEQMSAFPEVQADQKRLEQVLDVLLTNAIHYTPVGGQITICTQTRRRGKKQWAGFSVSDTGLGIPLEEQSMMFIRFFRGKVGRDSGVSGTGLGLAIAKDIVGWHQGRIDVESEGIPGKGSTFTVWLPV